MKRTEYLKLWRKRNKKNFNAYTKLYMRKLRYLNLTLVSKNTLKDKIKIAKSRTKLWSQGCDIDWQDDGKEDREKKALRENVFNNIILGFHFIKKT